MLKERVTTQEAAKQMGVCKQRITAKLKDGHFPNAGWCECGRSRMIPVADIESDLHKKDK